MIYWDGKKPMPKRLRTREIERMLENGELALHVTVDPHPKPKNLFELYYAMQWWLSGIDEHFVYYSH